MKQNYTDITIILDRSGSMGTIQNDTIGGVNRFIEDQRKAPGEASFTLVQFDDQYEPGALANIKDAPPLTRETYQPRGWTALHGAIGRTVADIGTRLKGMPESERPCERFNIYCQLNPKPNPMTIWKYVLDKPVMDIEMPQGATILTVQTQHGKPCLWALVDENRPRSIRTFVSVGTGHEFPKALAHHYYIGTFQIEGTLVFHVFESLRS